MKFMIFVKANETTEAGVMPDDQMLREMMKYNEELVKAGIMLDGGGLTPSSRGAKVQFNGTKRTVVDGPFTEVKELIAGYWLWECKSLAEAIEWVKRCPNPTGSESEIEIRPLMGMEDFPDASAETRALNDRLEAEIKQQRQQH
ncbi:MAG: YciI family protein [Kofleriaceae bacterium]|nr:YciI family protein [Kofleriaceae bacterium]